MDTHPPADSIALEVRRIIADTLRAPVEAVGVGDALDDSRLGVDSLSLIKLNVLIEERFDITLPDLASGDAHGPRTVGDVVAIVESLVAARIGGAS